MEDNKRKWIRYPSKDLVSFSMDDDTEILVQTVNKSHKGIAVVYVGSTPPAVGQDVTFNIPDDINAVPARLKWSDAVHENVHILGFLLYTEDPNQT